MITEYELHDHLALDTHLLQLLQHQLLDALCCADQLGATNVGWLWQDEVCSSNPCKLALYPDLFQRYMMRCLLMLFRRTELSVMRYVSSRPKLFSIGFL